MSNKNLYDSFHISALVVKKLNDQLTAVEEIEFQKWLNSSDNNRNLFEKLLDESVRKHDLQQLKAFDADRALKNVQHRVATGDKTKTIFKNYFFKLAAAIVIIFSVMLWFYKSQLRQEQFSTKNQSHEKIVPGGNKAILTLANGTAINLQNAKNGTIANQGSIKINKTKDGKINYQALDPDETQALSTQYNTLYVPRGGQYQLTLPDGSKVWLNAESTLKYPVIFNYAERSVTLSGEAYFEVVHNEKAPFKVLSNGQTVEVLGTHFNVTSYPDDNGTITSLFQGSVKVSNSKTSSIIKPGQMIFNNKKSNDLHISPASEDEILAWKNGYFNFNNEDIKNIMKRISRWYDVEVDFQGDIQNKSYWGTFPRSQSLATLLKNLEQTRTIHFKVSGRRIIVMP